MILYQKTTNLKESPGSKYAEFPGRFSGHKFGPAAIGTPGIWIKVSKFTECGFSILNLHLS